MRAWVGAVAAASALLCVAPEAAAKDADGAYGRLDGDVGLELSAGGSMSGGGASLNAELAAMYLSTTGGYLRYIDALGASGRADARSISAGVWMRPVFLARFASDLEHGPAYADLFLDSIGLGIGAFWAQPYGAAFQPAPGLELSVGADLPLLARATGPFIGVRGALRFRHTDLLGPGGDLLDGGSYLGLVLGFRYLTGNAIVDVGDSLSR